jgi:hypothetical protein
VGGADVPDDVRCPLRLLHRRPLTSPTGNK